jgi:hypothetical protein
VKFLKLHNNSNDSASDDDVFLTTTHSFDGVEVNKSYQDLRSNKRRRLRRGFEAVGESSSDDETELQLVQRGSLALNPDDSVRMQNSLNLHMNTAAMIDAERTNTNFEIQCQDNSIATFQPKEVWENI